MPSILEKERHTKCRATGNVQDLPTSTSDLSSDLSIEAIEAIVRRLYAAHEYDTGVDTAGMAILLPTFYLADTGLPEAIHTGFVSPVVEVELGLEVRLQEGMPDQAGRRRFKFILIKGTLPERPKKLNREIVFPAANPALATEDVARLLAEDPELSTLFVNYDGRMHFVRHESRTKLNLVKLDPQSLAGKLSEYIKFFKSTQKGEIPTDCPTKITKILCSVTPPSVPKIERVVRCTQIDPAGNLMFKAGVYGTTLIAEGLDEAPPIMSFDEAKAVLADLFVDWMPEINGEVGPLIAAMLTPLIWGTILPYSAHTAMLILGASSPNSGKTTLMNMIIAAVDPCADGSVLNPPASDMEATYTFGAVLAHEPMFLPLDNWDRGPRSMFLETLLTAPKIQVRTVGTSGTVQVGTRSQPIVGSNWPDPSDALAQRSMLLFLRGPAKRPAGIKWVREGHESIVYATRNRARILGALAAIVRGWIAADRPRGKTRFLRSIGWSNTVGGICDFAGYPVGPALFRAKNEANQDQNDVQDLILDMMEPRVDMMSHQISDDERVEIAEKVGSQTPEAGLIAVSEALRGWATDKPFRASELGGAALRLGLVRGVKGTGKDGSDERLGNELLAAKTILQEARYFTPVEIGEHLYHIEFIHRGKTSHQKYGEVVIRREKRPPPVVSVEVGPDEQQWTAEDYDMIVADDLHEEQE